MALFVACSLLVWHLSRSAAEQKEVLLQMADLNPKDVLSESERHEIREAVAKSPNRPTRPDLRGADGRYAKPLIIGEPKDAAQGIESLLGVLDRTIFRQSLVDSESSICREFADHGTEDDKECLDYILNECAGSRPDKRFQNGVRDVGREPWTLDDFVQHPYSKKCNLTRAQVLALRLYTSAAFQSLNTPLRDKERTTPHKFPVTMYCIWEGLRLLRAVAAEDKDRPKVLWRGMKDVEFPKDFLNSSSKQFADDSSDEQNKKMWHPPRCLEA